MRTPSDRTLAQPKSAKTIPSVRALTKVGFALTALVLILYLFGIQLLDVLELKTYDMRLLARGTRAPAGDVVIGAIDEQSLAQLGRWPWSRATMANLVRKLDELGAKVIAFDVFFSESEDRQILDRIAQLETSQGYSETNSPYGAIKRALAADSSFARAIAHSGNVVLPMVFLMSKQEVSHLSSPRLAGAFQSVQGQAIRLIKDSGDGRLDFPMATPAGLVANLPELMTAAKYVGHINSIPDRDGNVRWTPLVMRYQGLFFPSADVRAVLLYKGTTHLALRTTNYGVTGLEIGNNFVATDENGRALIQYHGPEKTFPTFSVADLYYGHVSPGNIKNKIVLIGATARGLGDIRVTPFGPSYPGVEIRANTIQNLLDNDFIRRPGWMVIFDLLAILGFGVLFTLVFARVQMRTAIALTILGVVSYVLLGFALFITGRVWLNLVYPSLLVIMLFIASTVIRYFTSETEKRQIKGAFQHYVPPAVVDRIMENMDNLALGGEKRELTVLFSDIRGFTSLSETLAPEELVKLLNVYLTRMTDMVFRHEGLLDKYIGDAIMAVYGAPIHREDHAVLACRTALDMMRELHGLQAEWRAQRLPVMEVGIGINTGPMIVGNMGSRSRFDYTVIGDAVNLGSRIESLNKVYGTRVLISEFTYRQVKDDFLYLREVDVAQIKGRQEPVRIYELLAPEAYPHMDWLPEFNRGYELFRAGLAAQAQGVFANLDKTIQDPVNAYYLEHCKTTRRKPGF